MEGMELAFIIYHHSMHTQKLGGSLACMYVSSALLVSSGLNAGTATTV